MGSWLPYIWTVIVFGIAVGTVTNLFSPWVFVDQNWKVVATGLMHFGFVSALIFFDKAATRQADNRQRLHADSVQAKEALQAEF